MIVGDFVPKLMSTRGVLKVEVVYLQSFYVHYK